MTQSALFGPMVSSAKVRELISDETWVRTMIEVEVALAEACASAGLIPGEAAETIAARCGGLSLDVSDIGLRAKEGANPVIPLVETLREVLPEGAKRWVHYGATSQDILDTAMMVIAWRVLGELMDDLRAACEAAARLAEEHRGTVAAARTLMQQAVPTTFGLKAAGWLVELSEALAGLRRVWSERLAVQLGGAAGTLAVYGDKGPEVVEEFAKALGFMPKAPVLPWHSNRVRVAELAAAMSIAAGACAKVANDVVLMAQTEVGEVAEAAAPGRGRSSAMPQKRNPVGSIGVIAAARQAHAYASSVMSGMAQEHERAAGAWQAEWLMLNGLFAATSGATSGIAEVLGGLEVHPERMRANLEAGGGMAGAEAVMSALAETLGQTAAQERVRDASAAARASGERLAEVLVRDEVVAGVMSRERIEELLDPANAVGAAGKLVDAALEAYRKG